MKRREFLSTAAAAGAALWVPGALSASPAAVHAGEAMESAALAPASGAPGKLLILIELKGGNDGLNTVVPFADPAYRSLRPRIGVTRDAVLHLDERTGLHPALQPLMSVWHNGELAIAQGLGYAPCNLSHFRATEIWDTASDAQCYLRDGWLARAFALSAALPVDGRIEGLVVGSPERGPLGGCAQVAVLPLADWHAAAQPFAESGLATTFPSGRFGASIRTAMQTFAAGAAEAPLRFAAPRRVIRLTLDGFDTHANQRERHAALLAQLGQGCAALRAALLELGWWNDALVVTHSEFGRQARENDAAGTGHGSSAAHFVMGGRVRGGLYGAPPALSMLDGNGNVPMSVDFRRLYATLLGSWWGIDAAAVLQRHFEPLPLLNV